MEHGSHLPVARHRAAVRVRVWVLEEDVGFTGELSTLIDAWRGQTADLVAKGCDECVPTGVPIPAPTSVPLPGPTAAPIPAPTLVPSAVPTPAPSTAVCESWCSTNENS